MAPDLGSVALDVSAKCAGEIERKKMKGAPDIILPKVAYIRKKVKKCKHCHLKLSEYNENEYCFAHTVIGAKKETSDQQIRERLAAAKLRKYKKMGL